ncbi:hypothetical protein [Prauserella flavalba]|uniref:hypothetical protein n=1 Tax=Prauserella flavalba TaxID=1477506 RepID=UPI0036E85838
MNGIAQRLETISGLRVSPTVPSQINPPAAIVGPPDIPDYRSTFKRGRWRLVFTVTVLVSKTVERIGQTRLASYADVTGPTSIPLAIEGDRSLGGIVEECYVSSFRVLGAEEVGQLSYYGGLFEIPVVAEGK